MVAKTLWFGRIVLVSSHDPVFLHHVAPQRQPNSI
jgi:hypothetical protein